MLVQLYLKRFSQPRARGYKLLAKFWSSFSFRECSLNTYIHSKYIRYMSVTVTIKVRRELVEVAKKMVKYSIAKSRSHVFNIMIERA